MKLGALLAGNARRNPDALAVVCGARRLTLAELNERANRFANALLDKGLKAGDRVAVYLPNGVEVVEAMAGVVKTGALITPLSPRLTEREVHYILGNSEPKVIVFPESHRESLGDHADHPDTILICVGTPRDGEEEFETIMAEGSAEAPPSLPPMPDDCVVSYTSGTTGYPKGAVGTHQNFIAIGGLIAAPEWELTPKDIVFASTPLSHRAGLARMANSFHLGNPLILQPRFDPEDAVEVIAKEGVTVLSAVPTIIRLMMPEIEKNADRLKKLRLVVTTGESFPEPLKKQLFSALPHVQLHSFLAQTEAGVICSLRHEDHARKPGAAGFPIPGVDLRLVDKDLKDVKRGEVGEIIVRCGVPGAYTIMREYFRNPQATKETLVDGWLRTGDLAYEDEAGYLFFADRAKDMIVSGGLNIYSREVEVALLEHPAVADAAVFAVPDPEFGEAVMACVQLRDGKKATADELIAFCREQIASYKKPKHVRFMDEFPRTSAGKVQKHELKKQLTKEFA